MMVISSKSTKQEYNFLCHLMFIGCKAFSPRLIIDLALKSLMTIGLLYGNKFLISCLNHLIFSLFKICHLCEGATDSEIN